MQDAYYLDRLYPLQDEVLRLLSGISSDFYLTGGTALSRHYLHHRYSDDLDFFLNNDPDFQKQAETCIKELQKHFQVNVEVTSPHYALAFVVQDGLNLKIDFVNDVPYRAETPLATELFIRTDHWRNILSNKISALQRNAPKDIADIFCICQTYSFDWMTIINDAKSKDMWVNELQVAATLDQYKAEDVNVVRWVKNPDYSKISISLKTIAKDILLGGENSLCKK